MTAWQGGVSLSTQYTLDKTRNGQVLAAIANGQTTFYAYGLTGPLAEFANEWAYYLPDGQNTVRQMSDGAGGVTLARSYTPWGEVLAQSGVGSFTWGYFGGLVDAATGLMYVGNGQYYDPATGRFLTRVNTSGPNPYVPGRGDPLGAMLAPIALVALVLRRRKGKHSKVDQILLVLMVLAGVSMGLVACGSGSDYPYTPEPPQPPHYLKTRLS
jgi:RHS repeat-associated protein